MAVGSSLTDAQEARLGIVWADLMSTTGSRAAMVAFLSEINDAITGVVPAGSISTAELADLAVTAAKLGPLAVETAKIDDLAVTNAKLAAVVAAALTRQVSKSIVAADVAALGAVLNGQIDFDAALPAGAVPKGCWIEKGTDWSGGAIGTMTASIGIAGGDVDRYTTPGNIFTGAGAGNLFAAGVAFDGTEAFHPEGAVTPSVNFVATGANLDQLAAGDLIAHFAYSVPIV
jgi:hypothetical protein